jgi:hypothetical protein
VLGATTLFEGQLAQGERLIRKGLAIRLAFLGLEERELGETGPSQGHHNKALRIACRIRAYMPLVTILPLTSLWMLDQGQAERAIELYALTSRSPHVANSRWYEEVVRQHIAIAAATLPKEIVESARERGRGRDLEATAREPLVELIGDRARTCSRSTVGRPSWFSRSCTH